MKKIILSIVAILAFGFANAQGVKFGAKAALNVANLKSDSESPSSLIGFQVGAFAEFKLTEKFAFQPELMYSAQGAKESMTVDSNGTEVPVEVKYKLGYINVPLMAKYYFTPSFNFEAGPQVGFILSGKGEAKATYQGVSASQSVDIKDQMNSVDFGLNFGLGYDFTQKIGAGVRYYLGLSNINDDGTDASIKNNVFSVSLSYKF